MWRLEAKRAVLVLGLVALVFGLGCSRDSPDNGAGRGDGGSVFRNLGKR